jgi:hypothetical protein
MAAQSEAPVSDIIQVLEETVPASLEDQGLSAPGTSCFPPAFEGPRKP